MFRRSNIPLEELQPRRIALIKPSALGDIVHSLPVLTALRQRFPAARLAWIVNRVYAPLLQNHPDLNEILPFDRHGGKGFWSFTKFLRHLRRQRFDLVIDLQGLLRTGVMTYATGAKRRIGLAGSREGARWFYSDVVPVADFHETHAVDRYWRVVEALGAGQGAKCFHVPLAPEALAWAREMLRACPRPWLLAGVGARWRTKRWPPEHFGELLRRAQEQVGGTAVFVGGGEETPLAHQAARGLTGPGRVLTGRTTLPQLAAVLSLADVMVANDTGPLHLAVALGRPVVAPYTCTKVSRTGPYGQRERGVETRIWCHGSYFKQCPRLECMAELTPDRLWPHLRDILHSWLSQAHSA